MDLDKQIAIKDKLQPYLSADFYALVAPANNLWFNRFKTNATKTGTSLHTALSDEQTTRHAIATLPPYLDYRIYIISRINNDDDPLVTTTLQEYCKLKHINVSMLSLSLTAEY